MSLNDASNEKGCGCVVLGGVRVKYGRAMGKLIVLVRWRQVECRALVVGACCAVVKGGTQRVVTFRLVQARHQVRSGYEVAVPCRRSPSPFLSRAPQLQLLHCTQRPSRPERKSCPAHLQAGEVAQEAVQPIRPLQADRDGQVDR